MSPRSQLGLHLATLVVVRILATAFAWHAGFYALSDDDFARVVIAQQFANAPCIDPSGTSWLPAPFWATGAWMMALGNSLTAARAFSLVMACVASALLYLAARASGTHPRASLLGSLLATATPLSVFTGAATVPELPTATLGACALLLLRRRLPAFRLAASAAILPATLARYEVWPVAVVVAAAAWLPARPATENAKNSLPLRLAASILAVLGPLAWIAWNGYAHGDFLHFHTRVSSFWSAYLSQHDAPVRAWLGGYPKTLLLHVPEASLLAALALIVSTRATLRSWSLPAIGALAALLALTLAAGTGGAPTHHPERPLLMIWLLAWIAIADIVHHARPKLARPAATLGLLAAVATLVSFGARVRHTARTYGSDRTHEIAVGRWLHRHAQGAVLVEPIDYGYFAIEAALARPGHLRLARSVDPRKAQAESPHDHDDPLRAALQKADARWLVVSTAQLRDAAPVGQQRERLGPWSIVEVDAAW